MPFRYIEHESDLYIEGCGKDIYKAMTEIAKGILQVMNDRMPEKSEVKKSKGIHKTNTQPTLSKLMIEREDTQSLVIDTFSEILVEIESEEIQPTSIEIKRGPSPTSAYVVIKGIRTTPYNIIKAVTWHGFKIEKKDNNICVRVLFDI